MRNSILLSLVISLSVTSCDSYEQSEVTQDYVSSLNAAITHGQENNAPWINSPEAIARHLFPPISHDGGPGLYQVDKKMKSATTCRVTITEEGPIDDEVLGERHTLHFRVSNSLWTIVNMKHEVKRRY